MSISDFKEYLRRYGWKIGSKICLCPDCVRLISELKRGVIIEEKGT